MSFSLAGLMSPLSGLKDPTWLDIGKDALIDTVLSWNQRAVCLCGGIIMR